MSLKERFLSSWRAKFPTSDVPELPFTENDLDTQQLESAYKTSQKRIRDLKRELQQQEFISGFIWDQLHGSQSDVVNSDEKLQGNDSQVSNARKRGETDANGLETNVRLAKSESLSEQEELWYPNAVDVTEDGKRKLEREDSVFSADLEHEGMSGLRCFLGSLRSEADIKSVEVVQSSSKVFNSEGDTHVNKAAPEINNKSESEINNEVNQVNRNHDKTTAASAFEEVRPNTTRTFKETNLDDLTSFEAGYRSSLTDSEKALLHVNLDRTDSASSVDSNTGERRKRPPIPTPRPSLKGPSVNKRASGASVNTNPPNGTGSDSDPVDEFKQEYYGVQPDEKKPASPSSIKRTVQVQKSAPPLLKRRGNKKGEMANTDVQNQDSDEGGTQNTNRMKLETNQKSKSLDSGSPSVESPPLPARASGIYRRGVYVNSDDKARQKFLARNYRVDSKGSQGSVDSVDGPYDNVVPVQREDGETSSEDEEPIYYNVLLMKQHSLHKVRTVCETIVSEQIKRACRNFFPQRPIRTARQRLRLRLTKLIGCSHGATATMTSSQNSFHDHEYQ